MILPGAQSENGTMPEVRCGMPPERWREIEAIFHSALQREPDARNAFVIEACGGDAELQREVISLISKDQSPMSALSHPVAKLALDSTTTALMCGTQLGPYRIEGVLGAGGMGQVYQALDTRLGRKVAVKVSAKRFSERFEREARAIAALNHPHVCTLYDIGPNYLVMELLEGETLAARLRNGPLSIELVGRYGAEIADALAAAHARGIVHRDLKPGNIMLTKSGAKVLDFGLAKIAAAGEDQQGPETLTASEAIMGTPAYMAPEQRDGRPCDGRTDVYALGLVLCEMATGNRSQVLTGLPPRLAHLIVRCLEAVPGQRWQSAAEVRLELDRLSPHDGRVLAPRRRISRRLMLALAGLVTIALAAVTWWISGRWRPAGAHQIESLAVLPLEDLSGDPSQAYFADGMTEALITDLGKIGSLQVISRSAVMKYKGSHRPAPEIARELRVDGVVEGSVLRASGRVVITAHLISPETNRQLWSERYERDARDVLDLTGDVAQAIAQGISARLTTQERATLARRRPVIPEAHEAYLQGRYYWAKVTDEAITKSIGLFQQASHIDPSYPLAYSGLADSYIILGGTILGAAAPRDTMPKAKEAALKALSLDDSLAEAHASLAMVLWRYDWDWSGAEREFKRALELNPSYATGRQWYGWYLYGLGRTVESVAEMGRAARLDPQSPWIRSNVGFAYYFARQYDRAIEETKHSLDMDSNFLLANFFLGLAYEQTRQLGQATAALEQAVDRSGRSPAFLAALGHALAVSGKKAEALKVQREVSEIAKRRYVPAYETAVLWDGLGDRERAMVWLEKGHEEHSGWMVYLDVDPRLDDLHADSRFQDLVRAVGLPK